ncbi:MAG: hypothetical protein MUC85_02390 [Anaerolineales bacterium]|jgi:hypothetical protein|nr:hypothetical protein [Anaerolineales bacterium]
MKTLKVSLYVLVLLAFLSGCNPSQQSELPSSTPGELRVSVTEVPPTQTPTPQPSISKNDVCGNQFYPIVDGASWTYSITAQDNPPTLATHSIATVNDGSFTLTVQGMDANGIFTMDGTCGDDGIILMNVPGISATYSSDGGGSTLSTTNDDGMTIPDDIQVGDDWLQKISVVGSSEDGQVNLSATIETTYKAVGYETVTVPAGTFYALKVEQTGSMTMGGTPAFETHGFTWYAQGIGTVKSGLDGTYTSELVSYTIP